MPELPEVEVTRLSFAERIAGGQIQAVRLGKPLRWPVGADPASMVGLRVSAVRRRGKYLLFDLSDGRLLLLHLGMSGSLRYLAQLPVPGPHDHFDLVMDCGSLRLHDPRRFGAVVLTPGPTSSEATKLLGHLGVEPLSPEFAVQAFYNQLQRRTTAIKQVLLAGELVVGVGNIYACESLFLAGIHPAAPAAALSLAQVTRLHQAIRQVLACAIAQGGSTLRDFSSADGQAGHFQLQAQVYGRAGQACTQCQQTVQVCKQGQRSSYYCPVCQAAQVLQ
jgi:formamidopyrimidine-DNA glycosylase